MKLNIPFFGVCSGTTALRIEFAFVSAAEQAAVSANDVPAAGIFLILIFTQGHWFTSLSTFFKSK